MLVGWWFGGRRSGGERGLERKGWRGGERRVGGADRAEVCRVEGRLGCGTAVGAGRKVGVGGVRIF